MSKINQNWVFGKGAGLNFYNANATNPPTPTSGYLINTFEGCASISDKNGHLLFYTDGVNVWDVNNVLRIPSLSPFIPALLGDPSSTQSAIIVPDPGNSNQYYIFTIDGSSQPVPPFNHINGGLLNIVSWVFTPLSSLITLPSTIGFSPAEKVIAVQHKNCKDFWVITILQTGTDGLISGSGVNNGQGTFRVFLVNSAGVQYVADTSMNIPVRDIGYLKGSPNGHLLALANHANKNVLVYPFDNATGIIDIVGLKKIALPTTKGVTRNAYGVEFSPNSTILYYGTLSKGTAHIFQVDLLPTVPISTLVGTIHNSGGRYAIGAFQLGVDRRIYFSKDAEKKLGAILNPDILGVGCTVTDNYITLPQGTMCYLGLPNMISNICEIPCD